MLAWAVWVALIGFWIMSVGLLAAAGLALRAVLRRRLAVGSRLFLWREPKRVLEGGEAVRVGLLMLILILLFALPSLGLTVQLTSFVVGGSARLN